MTDPRLDSGGQSSQATTNRRGPANQPGGAGQTGRLDDPSGIADQQQLDRDAGQFRNRTFDDRTLMIGGLTTADWTIARSMPARAASNRAIASIETNGSARMA